MKTTFLLLVLLYGVPCIYCACQHTPIIECENIEDLKDFNSTENVADWSVLKVGNVEHPSLKAVKLSDFITPKFFTYAETFIITGQINKFIPEDVGYCGFEISALKTLSLYKNDLKEGFGSFPVFTVDKLLLIDNNIHKLEFAEFVRQEVRVIDLSNNQLETLEERSMPNSAKVIIINNNKLREIHPETFYGSDVEELSLNYNNLESIKYDVLSKLPKLKTVLLKHNKFTTPNDILQHPSVQYLDLSHNKIEQLTACSVSKNLKELDLGSNDISEASNFLNSIIKNKNNESLLQVSLTYNKLKSINVLNSASEDVIQIRVYGNPWDCSFWEEKKSLINPFQEWRDRHLFNTTTYCIDYAKTKTNEINLFVEQWIQNLYEKECDVAEKCNLHLNKPNFSKWCVA